MSPACCFCRRNSLVCRGIFFLESAFSADSLTLQCSYSPLVQSHALTSVHRLKILSAGSHTVVWMQENTARIRSTLEDGFCLPKEQGGLKIAAYAVCLYTHTHTHTHTHNQAYCLHKEKNAEEMESALCVPVYTLIQSGNRFVFSKPIKLS